MSQMPLGIGGGIAVAVYVAMLLVVALVARRARRDDSLGDFYLAGRGLGPLVLFFTLYATQYSGNSLLGYPGEAYRLGFAWVMSVGFMLAIVVAYLAMAPRLFRVARRFRYVTPGDWIEHRFGSPVLTHTANLLWVAAIANYLLAQLMAMGHVVAGLSGDAVPYWVGVIVLTLVIIVYETLGGMRAVAWTDGVQGVMLVTGLVGLMVAVVPTPASLERVTEWIIEHEPRKAAVPSWSMCVTWVSTVVMIGLSAAVYPQAIQRIYAAEDARALKRSVGRMAFMPLVTMTPIMLLGIFGIEHFAGLSGVEADQVLPRLLAEWATRSLWLYAMAILVVLAVVAAIMSTADSVLLSLSSILAKDVLGRSLLRGAPEARLTHAGKVLSWVVMACLVTVALVPRITLWGLIELKMELLVQVAPAFFLGLRWRGLTARATLTGMIAGVVGSLLLPVVGFDRPWGVHAGLVGLTANLALCVILSAYDGRSVRGQTVPQLT